MNWLSWMEEWQDFDWAAFHLGVHLGLWEAEEFQKHKWRWWVGSQEDDLGTVVLEFMDALVTRGVLEFDPDNMCYRRKRGDG